LVISEGYETALPASNKFCSDKASWRQPVRRWFLSRIV
jgi:hypothetical protein